MMFYDTRYPKDVYEGIEYQEDNIKEVLEFIGLEPELKCQENERFVLEVCKDPNYFYLYMIDDEPDDEHPRYLEIEPGDIIGKDLENVWDWNVYNSELFQKYYALLTEKL